MEYLETDGGRSKYYKGRRENDCVIRAIAIATEQDYKKVFEELMDLGKTIGVYPNNPKAYERYLKALGWEETRFGKNAIPLDEMTFENKWHIAYTNSHFVAVKGRKVYDTWDCRHQRVWRVWTKTI